MSDWTQAVCAACYAEKERGREPCRVKAEYRDDEICCFCGRQTREGIYYRVDPQTVPYPRQEQEA